MAYDVVRQSADAVAMAAAFSLTNYSGTRLDLQVHREVRLLTPADAWQKLGLTREQASSLPVSLVAFESDNRITNAGREESRRN